MSDYVHDGKPTIFPYFSYRDAAAALDWLSRAFGFEKTVEVHGADGKVMHAEMTVGNGAIMLGSSSGAGHSLETLSEQGVYVYVEDVDAHFERAKAAGATIVLAPEDTGWGTRRYRVLDREGYEWSFGSFRPGVDASGS